MDPVVGSIGLVLTSIFKTMAEREQYRAQEEAGLANVHLTRRRAAAQMQNFAQQARSNNAALEANIFASGMTGSSLAFILSQSLAQSEAMRRDIYLQGADQASIYQRQADVARHNRQYAGLFGTRKWGIDKMTRQYEELPPFSLPSQKDF